MKKVILLTVLLGASAICYAPKNQHRQSNMQYARDEFIKQEVLQKRIFLLLKTIRLIESKDQYHIKGRSGEYGAYQFMTTTWIFYCRRYFNKVLDIKDPISQDKVAREKIKELVNRGYTNEQIASIWNCGSANYEGKLGRNKKGIYYNVPNHIKKFTKTYNELTLISVL